MLQSTSIVWRRRGEKGRMCVPVFLNALPISPEILRGNRCTRPHGPSSLAGSSDQVGRTNSLVVEVGVRVAHDFDLHLAVAQAMVAHHLRRPQIEQGLKYVSCRHEDAERTGRRERAHASSARCIARRDGLLSWKMSPARSTMSACDDLACGGEHEGTMCMHHC
eukprot:1021594-Pleurochrysis_carterae.AAC.2